MIPRTVYTGITFVSIAQAPTLWLNTNPYTLQHLLADLWLVLDWHPSRVAMRIRAGAAEQTMLMHIFQVGLDNLLAVVGMIDLNAVDRKLGAHLIEQLRRVEGEAVLTSSGMSNQADRAAFVGRLHRLSHI